MTARSADERHEQGATQQGECRTETHRGRPVGEIDLVTAGRNRNGGQGAVDPDARRFHAIDARMPSRVEETREDEKSATLRSGLDHQFLLAIANDGGAPH